MYPADYVDDLIQKTLEYCKDDDDKPPLPTAQITIFHCCLDTLIVINNDYNLLFV